MSPTAFKQHVTQLLSDLARCQELCDNILVCRHVGSKHDALDRLHDGLKATAYSIEIEYNTLRKVFGSRMDIGDDASRYALKSAIRTIELDVQSRLSDVANRRNNGLPGFRDMFRHVQIIEQNVRDALEAFAQRLERPAPVPTPKPAPKPTPKPEVKKPTKPDEIVMRVKDLERYTEHMKNSWMETLVDRHILYVNCWDEKKNTWEKPSGGFIKALPKSSRDGW